MSSFVARMAARRKAQLTDHQLSEECVAVVNAAADAIEQLRLAAEAEHALEFGPPPPEALPSVVTPPPAVEQAPPPPPPPPVPAVGPSAGDAVEDVPAAPADGEDAPKDADATATADNNGDGAAAADEDTAAVAGGGEEVKTEAVAVKVEAPAVEESKKNDEDDAAAAAAHNNSGESEVVTAAKLSMEARIKALLKWHRSEEIANLSGVEGVLMSEDLAGGVVATAAIAQYAIDHPVEGVAGPTSVEADVAEALAGPFAVPEAALPRWREWIAHLLLVGEGKTLAKEPPVAAAAVPAAIPPHQQQQQPQYAALPPAATLPPAPAPVGDAAKLTVGQAISKITSLHNFPADPLQEARCGVSPHNIRLLEIPPSQIKHLGYWLRVLHKGMSVEAMRFDLGLPESSQNRELLSTFMTNPPRVNADFGVFRRRPNRLVSDVHPDLPTTWNVSTRVVLPISIDARKKFWCIVACDLEGYPLGVSPTALPSPQEAFRSFMDNYGTAGWLSPSVSPYLVSPALFAGCNDRLMTYTDGPDLGDERSMQNRIVRRLAAPALTFADRVQRYTFDATFGSDLNKMSVANAVRAIANVVGADMLRS